MDAYYKSYVNGVEPIPYETYLKIAGLKLTDLNAAKNEAYLGANSTNTNGKVLITSVVKNSPAYTFGINVNDEILSIDKYRTDDLTKALSYKKAGDKISILLSRDGMIKTIEVTLVKNTTVKYKIEKVATPSPEQEAAYKQWIR